MALRWLAALAALSLSVSTAHARRVALVIGQSAYTGTSTPASLSFPKLVNPKLDAKSVAELLAKNGFDVIACDGKTPGCFDLTRVQFGDALTKLEQAAKGADLAFVFFAGHGLATPEGNILAATDARLDCATGSVEKRVMVEEILKATRPAAQKLVILDACRDNPIGNVCPGLKGKTLAFERIEAGDMQGMLLVTSTQFGQQALDGPSSTHSPFATALFSALGANPTIYFEQVMNEVARATYEAAQKQGKFLQVPGRVVGGVAPADCLAGKACVGDARMASLAAENDKLTVDASGVRNLLAAEEAARGKPYSADERGKRVAELEATLKSIGGTTDPLRLEAKRLIDGGNVTGGTAKLDEALDADEKAILEAEKVAAEKRKQAARSARDLAVLASGRDVAKALTYYARATKLDPSDANTWRNYARAAVAAGKLDVAKGAYEQAALKARDSDNTFGRYWATLGLGDVALAQGSLPSARRLYETASAIIAPLAKAAEGKTDKASLDWQRDLSVSYNKVGDVLVAQGDLPEALKAYRDSLAIFERLAKSDAGNAGWQRDLSVSYIKFGDVLVAQGDLPEALKAYRDSLAIAERLAKSDAGNLGWQRDLSVSYNKVGDVLVAQGDLPEALKAYRDSLAIAERLAKSDAGNAGWQRDLSVSYEKVGDVLVAQGDLPEALKAYRDSLAIRERLAKSDAGNAGWQRDLAVSYGRVASIEARQGERSLATSDYKKARDIILGLKARSPDNATLPNDLAFYEAQIAELEKK